MQQEIGRNDPCPCGSGKKYKKCCAKAPMGARTIKVIQQGANPLQKKISAILQEEAPRLDEGRAGEILQTIKSLPQKKD